MSSSRFRRADRLGRVALAGLLAVAVPVGAMTFSEARSRINALRASGSFDLDRQEPILEGLENWSRQFYAQVDRGQEGSARSLFESLHPLLRDLHQHNESKTEGMVRETIRVDGDLEATQDSPTFRNAEIARIRALYHLNWVSYLGATLLPESDPRRKRLLEFAAGNFGEFVVGPDEAVAREALFGRGQAHRGLGETNEALSDLRRLVALGSSVPQYAKARISIVETLLEAGRTDEALREADAVIADATAGKLPAALGTEARLDKAQALFVWLKRGEGSAATRQARLKQALSLLRQVERYGSTWRTKARAVANWGLANLPEADLAAGTPFAGIAVAQALLAKGEYAKALERLEQAIDAGDTPKETKTEARFLAGVAAFQLDRYASTATHLRAYLDASPRSTDAAEASYLLFKSLERLAEAKPSDATDEAYRGALRSFVEGYPKHSAHAEARFRLAEILRDEGDLLGAVEQFRRVEGNETLEVYARFNAAQAMFRRLQDPPKDVPAEQLREERGETVQALAALAARLTESDDPQFRELAAKATLMGAMTAVLGADPDYGKALGLVENFSVRFPDREELARQAFALEILALQNAGDTSRVTRAIDAYLANVKGAAAERRALLKRLGREFFAQSESERASGRPELASVSSQIAIEIYETLLSELPEDPSSLGARRGVEALLGRLHLSLGHEADAALHYGNLLRIDPRSPEALAGLAEIAGRTGKHGKATDYWAALAKVLEPGEDEWFDARFAAAREAGAAGDHGRGCSLVRETHDLSPFPLTGKEKKSADALDRELCSRKGAG